MQANNNRGCQWSIKTEVHQTGIQSKERTAVTEKKDNKIIRKYLRIECKPFARSFINQNDIHLPRQSYSPSHMADVIERWRALKSKNIKFHTTNCTKFNDCKSRAERFWLCINELIWSLSALFRPSHSGRVYASGSHPIFD